MRIAVAATLLVWLAIGLAGAPAASARIQGQIVERYAYDRTLDTPRTAKPSDRPAVARGASFGESRAYGGTHITDATGSEVRAASLYGNPFGFTGQRYDAGVGLYHFRHRTYSPSLGRWLQRDPAGYVDGVNLYEYAFDNPLRFVDPLGLGAPRPRDVGAG